MWRECLMKLLSRRATSGTEIKIYVPDVAQIHENTCQNTRNLAQNSKKPLCHSWHKNILKVKNLQHVFADINMMINRQFYFSNHRCEVCAPYINTKLAIPIKNELED